MDHIPRTRLKKKMALMIISLIVLQYNNHFWGETGEGEWRTYIMITVTANVDFANTQLCSLPDALAASQLFDMYHAIFDECAGSEWSGPICPYILTHHSATMARLVTVDSKGYQTCNTNMTTLTSRMKVVSTEIATLKSVILFSVSLFPYTHPKPPKPQTQTLKPKTTTRVKERRI